MKNEKQKITPATEQEFKKALEAEAPGTNIYGWEGTPPKPGYYRQGGTLIWIYNTPIDGCIGEAVQW